VSIQVSGTDVIDLAVQTEVRGERFYREAATSAVSQRSKALFEYLADEEQNHRETFVKLGETVVSEDVQPAILEEAMSYIEAAVDTAFFRESTSPLHAITKDTTEEELLEQALAFEKETLLFFIGLLDLVRPASRKIVERIAAEERRHIARLHRMLQDQRREV